jgi:hypothetical protein
MRIFAGAIYGYGQAKLSLIAMSGDALSFCELLGPYRLIGGGALYSHVKKTFAMSNQSATARFRILHKLVFEEDYYA